MNKLDSKEFEMLAGTTTMEELIRNRVAMRVDDREQALYDAVEHVSTAMYFIRRISDYQTNFYFSSPIDRSRFIDYCGKNQNI